ncbi:hypothetical protein BN1080_01454 [Planococcus massiliensis]|uniref:Helix-turn-helix domain protein n=1 Tax=Planococcus massiliensis TaxID=1499687 RepID=A0A098EL50_9BACL|nr:MULTISPECIES: hypothetical protein [Planococcus]MCJ1907291.1 hypothetical protein [Planococcus ruber]CEG22525.1 hypothetical protein BN1080_01454 [Planococcus massiliensis]
MKKIQGIENLLIYLNSKECPMTEAQIRNLITLRTIPHSQPFGDMLIFDKDHIDWWVTEQRNQLSRLTE